MFEKEIGNIVDLQNQMDELKEKLDLAKSELITMMEESGCDKVKCETGSAQLVFKSNIKYSDELSIINFCKNNGYGQFIVEKVNTTALNKELKKGGRLTESLDPFFNESTTKVLTVKSDVVTL